MQPDPAASGGSARLLRALEWVVWAFLGAWALASLFYPFGWDQGLFAYVGQVINRGGLPYRDAFEIKGPATYYLYALAQRLLGHNLWGIRLFDVVGVAFAAHQLGQLAASATGGQRQRFGGATGRWAAALYVAWFASLSFWHTAQPDGFVATLSAVALFPWLRALRAPKWWADAALGATVGLCALFKPQYAAYAVVPLVFLLAQPGWRVAPVVRRLSLIAAGAVSVVGLMLLWLWREGALGALIEVHLTFNAQVYSSSGAGLALGARVQGLLNYLLAGRVFVVLLPVVLLGVVRLSREQRPLTHALVTWALLAVANVVVQNKFFDYQWAPLFPPVALFAAVGLHSLVASFSDPRPWVWTSAEGIGVASFLVLFLHASVRPLAEVANFAAYAVGLKDTTAFRYGFGNPGPEYRMTRYLKEHSRPTDHLVVMGWNAAIQYETGLPAPSRHFYSLPFWMGEKSPLQARYRTEFMRDLQARPPEYVVVSTRQAARIVGRAVALEEFPAFFEFLRGGYRRVTEFDELELYQRKH